MECLLFLWWNFALYLACYLHDTLHCNIYMDGTMCMDGTSLCMNNVYGWNWCDMWNETYVLDMWYGNISIYVIYICYENCWIKKTEKRDNMQALCRLPPTAKSSLPSAADGKEATWQPTVLPGSWPIWSVCLQWQTAKTLPSVADGKEPALCHQWQTAKNLPSSDV